MSVSGSLLPPPTVESYRTEEALTESMLRKGTANPGVGLYPRDGTEPVATIEEQVSEVTLGSQAHNVIMVSGMSAVREAVLFAADKQGPKPKLAYGYDQYSQSAEHFRKLDNIGVNTQGFNSGSRKDVESVLEQGADVVFAETVANGPNTPVLDIHYLLEALRSSENPPIAVLDNTLPLSTGLDFSILLRPDDPVMVVESATKNLMNNSELLGIVHSPNEDLIEGFRKHKAHSGAVNSISASGAILDKLSRTIPGFHERNRRVFSSTSKIATALAEANDELGKDTDFLMTHPTMASHPNHDLAQDLTPEGLDFMSPTVFIERTKLNAKPLIRRIAKHPALRDYIDEGEIGLGQSFGMPKARLLYDMNAPNVRFAGGFDLSDEEGLAAAIKEAAADL